jgi:hypothetical protein
MTWKIAWNEVALFSGDRTGRTSGGTTGVGKFGSRLSIGRNSILVTSSNLIAFVKKTKFSYSLSVVLLCLFCVPFDPPGMLAGNQ